MSLDASGVVGEGSGRGVGREYEPEREREPSRVGRAGDSPDRSAAAAAASWAEAGLAASLEPRGLGLGCWRGKWNEAGEMGWAARVGLGPKLQPSSDEMGQVPRRPRAHRLWSAATAATAGGDLGSGGAAMECGGGNTAGDDLGFDRSSGGMRQQRGQARSEERGGGVFARAKIMMDG
uniref:Uncharacterized protein n=1 Tax=Oryza nivara TaxID=4536 RepID=A0A0E0HN82_ORYNI